MTINNQVSSGVSSMLLMILIGLAIYFLCYSEGFSGTQNKEFFEDLEASNQEVQQQTDILGNMQDTALYSEPVQYTQPVISAPPLIMSQPAPEIQVQTQPIVSNNVIQEIVNSQPVYVQEQEPVQQPTMFEPKPSVQQEPAQPKLNQQQMQQSLNNQPTVSDFTANDEMGNDFGTELSSAFMAPLPPGTNPEVVNFKKVNNDNYNAKDFLPKQINDEWFETDFSLAKYQLNDDKLINTERYMIGINTVGQSLKNATYDIRGTIANPKLVVSPWNNSTYEPDFNLKPLC
jgi:hypothetical protein